MESSESFVLAVKRDQRSLVPPDWIEIVRGTPGVTIVGETNPTRIQVKASPEGLESLRRCLDPYVHIESVVRHVRY